MISKKKIRESVSVLGLMMALFAVAVTYKPIKVEASFNRVAVSYAMTSLVDSDDDVVLNENDVVFVGDAFEDSSEEELYEYEEELDDVAILDTDFKEYLKDMYVVARTEVRGMPTEEWDNLGILFLGDKVKVTGQNKDWYRINFKGADGFVLKEYVSDNKPVIKVHEKRKGSGGISYTDEDLDVFAHLLFAEAGSNSNSANTIYYTGSVVLNRVKSSKYPNTLLKVIYQKGQYSPTWNGFMNKTPTERCYKIAKDLLENGSVLPSRVLGQAGYSIYKRYGSKLYCESDGIYFFYIK